jgi:hypothetical protein
MRTIKSTTTTAPRDAKPAGKRIRQAPLTIKTWEKVGTLIWQAKHEGRTFRIKRGFNGADGVIVTERDNLNKEIKYEVSESVNTGKRLVETWL